MKKNIIVLFLILSLNSCFWDKPTTENPNVDDIKNELLQSWSTEVSSWSDLENTSTWNISEENTLETKGYNIKSTTDEQFLELDSLDWKKLEYWEIELTWNALQKVDKIEVNFSNKDSKFPNDTFELKKFKIWDKTFKYFASSKYKVLDYGENKYEFVAYSWDKISKLELTILIKGSEENKIEDEIKTSTWNTNTWSIWTIKTIDTKILETKKETLSWTTCETLNDYLSEKMNTWYYWNTCRPSTKWISFYLVKLNWKNYVYEKHYLNTTTWEASTQQLEVSTWNTETKDTIKDRNNELKLRNSEFDTSKSDALLK